MVRLGTFELRTCPSCRSWIALPRPTARALADYHDTDGYFDHPYLELRRSATAATRRRCAALFRHLASVAPDRSFAGGRMLDVGCDTGNLLEAARQQAGVAPFGVDVAHRAIQQAAARGIVVHHGPLESAPPEFGDFDLITAIDLVEHVAEPPVIFREFARRLRPGGLVYLETPNPRSSVYAIGRALWRITRGAPAGLFTRLFPAEHVEYYSRQGLETVASRAGFRVRAIGTRALPMRDIAVSAPLRAAIGVLQQMDRIGRRHALWWAVLERGA